MFCKSERGAFSRREIAADPYRLREGLGGGHSRSIEGCPPKQSKGCCHHNFAPR